MKFWKREPVVHPVADTSDRAWVYDFFSPCSTWTLQFAATVIKDILEERRAKEWFVDPGVA